MKLAPWLAVVALTACLASHAQLRILTDQIGYDAHEPKKVFVVEGRAGEKATSFVLRSATDNHVVQKGTLVYAGPVARWRFPKQEGGAPRVYWTGELAPSLPEGQYTLDVLPAGTAGRASCSFQILPDLLERRALSDVIFYFKGQRVSGDFERADERLSLPKELGPGVVDLRGGWYDATGDYGVHLSHQNLTSYFNPQQVPLVVWSLLASYESLGARADENFVQYRRRMLDEAFFGADFLVRLKRPGQSFLESITAPGRLKLARDREIGNPNWRTQIKTDANASTESLQAAHGPLSYQAGFRSGAGVSIAALALASTMPESGAFPAATYLQTARDAFDFLQVHNRELLNDGTENILDDYCALLAATELFHATREARYQRAAAERASHLMARLVSADGHADYWRADEGTRPFFHPSDAGMPVVALLRYRTEAAATEAERAAVQQAVRRAMEAELHNTVAVANPFGYARQLVRKGDGRLATTFFFPHDTEAAPWWQGENARLASLASAARLTARAFPEDPAFQQRLTIYADDQLHWILGRNPFDSCMLTGSGRNNAPYMFFRSYEYTSAPGSVVNGITSSSSDDDGIAFNEGFATTGKDEDWRWTEQWLPHAAWFMYAVSLPH